MENLIYGGYRIIDNTIGICIRDINDENKNNPVTLVYKRESVPKSKTDGTSIIYGLNQLIAEEVNTKELEYDTTYYGRVYCGDKRSKAIKFCVPTPKVYLHTIGFSNLVDERNTKKCLKEYYRHKAEGTCRKFSESFVVGHASAHVLLDYGETDGNLVDQMPDRYRMDVVGFSDTDSTIDVIICNYFNDENTSKSDEEKVNWMNCRMCDVINHLDGYIGNFRMPTEEDMKKMYKFYVRDKSPVFTITL